MDHLKICMDALRLLAGQPKSPKRVPLAERRINEYLQAEARLPLTTSLQRVSDAINKEAEQRAGNDFWITMQAYVQRGLRELEPEEPLPPPKE
jgi:hypothetical protein